MLRLCRLLTLLQLSIVLCPAVVAICKRACVRYSYASRRSPICAFE